MGHLLALLILLVIILIIMVSPFLNLIFNWNHFIRCVQWRTLILENIWRKGIFFKNLLRYYKTPTGKMYNFIIKNSYNVLCATSGDRCLLGGAKSPTAASSELRLALCTEAPWLEAVRTEMFCYHLFHAFLKCSSFIKTHRWAIKEFRIILLESQKRKLKIKCPCCSQGMSTSCTFVIWHHKEFQGRLFQQGGSQGQGAACSEPVLDLLWWSYLLYQTEQKEGFAMSNEHKKLLLVLIHSLWFPSAAQIKDRSFFSPDVSPCGTH